MEAYRVIPLIPVQQDGGTVPHGHSRRPPVENGIDIFLRHAWLLLDRFACELVKRADGDGQGIHWSKTINLREYSNVDPDTEAR